MNHRGAVLGHTSSGCFHLPWALHECPGYTNLCDFIITLAQPVKYGIQHWLGGWRPREPSFCLQQASSIREMELSPSRVVLASPSILSSHTLLFTTSPRWCSLWSRDHAALGPGGGRWGRARLSFLPPPVHRGPAVTNQGSGGRSHAGPAEAGGYIVLQEGMRRRSA